MDGTSVGSLYYDLDIDDKKLNSSLNRADKKVGSFGQKIGAYWKKSTAASKVFMASLAALSVAAVGFGVASVKAFQDSQDKIAQTNAVLKSTKGVAGVTAQAVTKLANAMQRHTKYTDEDVRSAENLLLTFTSIGKDVFPQATETVLDMSTALGQDTKNSAIQLGKALQDPVLGVTALRRVGVNFNKTQQETIARLVESGQKLKAQKMILKELSTEFGGSARAAAETFSGRVTILKNQFGDLQEVVGQVIVEALGPLVNWLSVVVDKIAANGGIVATLTKFWKENKQQVIIIAGAIAGMLLPAVISLTGSLLTFMATLAPWAALGVGVVLLMQKLGISFDDVQKFAKKAFTNVKGWFKAVKDGLPWAKIFKNTMQGLKAAFMTVRDVVVTLANVFMKHLWPSIKALASTLWKELLPAYKQLWDSIVRVWEAINPAFITALKIMGVLIGVAIVAQIWVFVNVMRIGAKVVSRLASVVSNLIKWFANLIKWAGNLAGAMWNAVKEIGKFFGRLPGYVGSAFRSVRDWFKRLPGMIRSAVGNLSGLLFNVGKSIISGLINGIKSRFTAVKDTLSNLTKKITSWKGPENVDKKLLVKNAQYIMQGFTGGLEAEYRGVRSSLQGFTRSLAVNPVINPSVRLSTAGIGGNGSAAGIGSGTNIRIGTVNDKSDADYIIRRVDRNQRNQSRGIASRD